MVLGLAATRLWREQRARWDGSRGGRRKVRADGGVLWEMLAGEVGMAARDVGGGAEGRMVCRGVVGVGMNQAKECRSRVLNEWCPVNGD